MTTSTKNNIALEQSVYVFPVSFTQEALWFLDQLEPESATYNNPVAIHLRGHLDVDVLCQSLNAIVHRHEALRTTFRLIEGHPVQVISASLTVPLSEIDLQSLPEAERQAEVQHLVTEEAQRPFDLMQGPLLRASALQLGAQEHLLLLTLHHIISDGWSINVFLRELTSLYVAFSSGQPSELPELPIQYADFALWQREMLQGDILAEHLAYWKQQLTGMTEQLQLPTDRPRPIVTRSHGATYSVKVSKALTTALKELSRQEGVTLYMTLVAAFQSLLARYSGQDDVVIGTVNAGRTQVETEGLIGFFANTLVLRTDLSGDPTFRELLRRVREVVLGAQDHQDLPFETLVKELRPERQAGKNPLFQVMLSFEAAPPSLPSGWRLAEMEFETETSSFDLTLELQDSAEGLLARLEYSTNLFDEATIARLLAHWQALLAGIVVDSACPLSKLPLLTGQEHYQQLVQWNDTQIVYPVHRCIHQLFEAQVERAPEAIAVVFEEQSLTYRELNVRANQLAHYLQALGVGPEVLVGMCVERSLEMVVGLLGILKAGGAYVPLDPSYPAERLAFMLADSQTPVLLMQHHLVAELPAYEGSIVYLDTDWEKIARGCEENPISRVRPTNLAYVIYTSGSSGKPKGVLVSHANVVRLFEATRVWFHFDNRDVWTLFHSYAFDFSVWELWGALLHGGRLVVVSYLVSRSPEAFYNLLLTEQVTVLNQTPSAFYPLIREEESSGTAQDLALRLVILGGEALEFQRLQPWFDRHGDRSPQLVNMYGITETTVHVTYYPLSLAQLELTSGSVIGRPISDLQVYILDQHQQLVPIGVPGEMYVGGAGLTRGYLNRLELTVERFISHLFNQNPNIRLYRTGDLARYLPDGNIEYLGRIDHQVKIRGFRVELGEIETVLSCHVTVQEALVLASGNESDEKHLVAYVVPRRGQNIKQTELYSFLRAQLPAYMVPSNFVILDSLPLTPNGKIDRQALPTPASIRNSVEGNYVAPTTVLHQQLVQIWEETLDVRPIGIRNNFFYIGGHSLLAVRLVDRIKQEFGKKIPLTTLFASPTIEHLATALMRELGPDSLVPLIAVQTGGTKRPFFYLHGDYIGGALHCFTLARALGADQPFYAIEPRLFDNRGALPTIKDMARANIEALKTVQPKGPYLLGGFCNGALIAYEMARQLDAQGEQVDLLVLIEPATLPMLNKVVHKVISRMSKLVQVDLEHQLKWYLHLRQVYQYVLHTLHLRNLGDFKQTGIIDPHFQSLISTTGAFCKDNIGVFDWMLADYSYSPYRGKATLFWCQEEPFRGIWRRKAKKKNIDVQFIPGTHLTCRTDHVQSLAEQMRVCLNKVQTTDAGEIPRVPFLHNSKAGQSKGNGYEDSS